MTHFSRDRQPAVARFRRPAVGEPVDSPSRPPTAGRADTRHGQHDSCGDLVANRGSGSWILAVASANQAGSIELVTGEPVMAMGGFTGSEPGPTTVTSVSSTLFGCAGAASTGS